MKRPLDHCDKCGVTVMWLRHPSTWTLKAFDRPETVPADELTAPEFVMIESTRSHNVYRSTQAVPPMHGETPVRAHSVSCKPRPHPPRRRHPFALVR